MPFDWMQSPTVDRDPSRANAARDHDILERAKMLLRLGYDRNEVKARLQHELEEEFELSGKVPTKKHIAALIKAAVERHEV